MDVTMHAHYKKMVTGSKQNQDGNIEIMIPDHMKENRKRSLIMNNKINLVNGSQNH